MSCEEHQGMQSAAAAAAAVVSQTHGLQRQRVGMRGMLVNRPPCLSPYTIIFSFLLEVTQHHGLSANRMS